VIVIPLFRVSFLSCPFVPSLEYISNELRNRFRRFSLTILSLPFSNFAYNALFFFPPLVFPFFPFLVYTLKRHLGDFLSVGLRMVWFLGHAPVSRTIKKRTGIPPELPTHLLRCQGAQCVPPVFEKSYSAVPRYQGPLPYRHEPRSRS